MLGLARKPRGKTVAVADVGGGSAGVAILSLSAEAPAHIVSAERSILPLEERAAEADRSRVLSSLTDVAQKALANVAPRIPKELSPVSAVYGIIRAPWSRSKTIRAESLFAEETRIDSELVASLAREAVGNDKEFDHANTLEAGVIRVELNGYPTLKPAGKRASRINVAVLLTDCDADIRAGVTRELSKVFPSAPAQLRSGTRALLSVLRESSGLPKECLIINTTASGTSMLTVRKGAVAETAALNEGTSSIVKRIGGERLPEEVLSLVRLLARDQCETDSCQAIAAALGKTEPELVKLFGEAFVKMSSTRRLPNRLVLAAHEDLSPWLVRFFGRLDFSQFTITTRPFSTSMLTLHDLEGLITYEGAARPDPDISLASALVNIEEHARA